MGKLMKIGDKVRLKSNAGLDVEAEIVSTKQGNTPSKNCCKEEILLVIECNSRPDLTGATFYSHADSWSSKKCYNYGNRAFWIEIAN
jgi:hypothetical protein